MNVSERRSGPSTDELGRRVDIIEEHDRERDAAIGDLQTVVLGPPPTRDNGLRGDLRALKSAFYKYKEACFEEDGSMKTAKINMAAIVLAAAIPSSISALVTIIVTIMARRS